jgi:NAD(P)-dependent dehydrogenase (short-subunit alcohol dehydrogenase family)
MFSRVKSRAMAGRFDGKVAIVTGGGGGIGRAVAERFASEGARVALVDVDEAGLEASVAAVERAGGQALAIRADVTQSADVQRYVDTTLKHFGAIDMLHNNAGILGDLKPLTEYPEETFDRVIAVNVRGVWLGLKHVAPSMRTPGAAIVNTASIAGLMGSRNIVAYTASKHAVVGLTRTAALELAPRGIRVNAICPAPIETNMVKALEAGAGSTARERLTATLPLRRFGEPAEVAALVAFLCSADAAYITGGIYTVDGGAMA